MKEFIIGLLGGILGGIIAYFSLKSYYGYMRAKSTPPSAPPRRPIGFCKNYE